jgi:hypothetical protein
MTSTSTIYTVLFVVRVLYICILGYIDFGTDQHVGVCSSASLASLTRETGPKVVRGDPKTDGQKAVHVEHHLYDSSLFGLSDSALKFTHILYNLSPAGKNLLVTCH